MKMLKLTKEETLVMLNEILRELFRKSKFNDFSKKVQFFYDPLTDKFSCWSCMACPIKISSQKISSQKDIEQVYEMVKSHIIFSQKTIRDMANDAVKHLERK